MQMMQARHRAATRAVVCIGHRSAQSLTPRDIKEPRTNNMAFDSPAKLRRSVAVAVAVAAPIETVVDPHLHHLDVAVPLDERVSGKESEPNRSNKCPVV